MQAIQCPACGAFTVVSADHVNLAAAMDKGLTDADVLSVLQVQHAYEAAVAQLTSCKSQFQVWQATWYFMGPACAWQHHSLLVAGACH